MTPLEEILSERDVAFNAITQTGRRILDEAKTLTDIAWEACLKQQGLSADSDAGLRYRPIVAAMAAAVAERCADIAKETASDVLGDGAYQCGDMAGHRKHVCEHIAYEIRAETKREE